MKSFKKHRDYGFWDQVENPLQIDPLPPIETDPRSPGQIDPLCPIAAFKNSFYFFI